MSLPHKPFVASTSKMHEFTFGPIMMGIFLGILFGASSLYLGLKVGMTVSASVPIAVMSITIFRAFSKMFKIRNTTILENNIVQTTGSAGESIAFGVTVTMPALMILGYDMDVNRIMIAAVLGSVLGVLMMIPLRKALIVEEHGRLPYPEGTACAEVLIAGEKGGATAKTVFGGFFAGLFYKVFGSGFKLWKEEVGHAFSSFKGASVGAELAPEMLGVGYIIGPKNGCIMIAGGILSSWVLIPMIKLFGSGLTTPLFPGTKLISDMSIHEIWKNYVLYIGAGAVTTGGIIALIHSLPVIIRGAKSGLQSVVRAGSAKSKTSKNTKGSAPSGGLQRVDHDLPISFVLVGSLMIMAIISLVPNLHMNLVGALMIIIFGFLFVTVSSRLTGEIGSSSNPISGMTVATLLFTSLIFLALGWTAPEYRVTALSVAAIVCVAASNAGTTSQDLKTGFLLGATPRYQQLGLLAGAITSALVIGYTLNLMNDASTIYSNKNIPAGIQVPVESLTESSKVYDPAHKDDQNDYKVLRIRDQHTSGPLAALSPGKYLIDSSGAIKYIVDPGINGTLQARDNGVTVQKFEAPKARLMSLIIDGILSQKLPWGLVLLGASIALLMELCSVSSLPFAVGVYLPMSTSAPIFLGGLVRWAVDRIRAKKSQSKNAKGNEEDDTGPGVLFSSGLIAGGSIAGIVLAIVAMSGANLDLSDSFAFFAKSEWGAILMFGMVMTLLFKTATSSLKSAKSR